MRDWIIRKIGGVAVADHLGLLSVLREEKDSSRAWRAKYKEQQQITDQYRRQHGKEYMAFETLQELLDNVIAGKRQMYKGVRIKAVPECKRKRDGKGRFADE